MIHVRKRISTNARRRGGLRWVGSSMPLRPALLLGLMAGLLVGFVLVGPATALGADAAPTVASNPCFHDDCSVQQRCQCSSPDCDHDDCKCNSRRGCHARDDRDGPDERPRLSPEVATMVDLLGAESGSVVADVGAGNGRFSVQLAGVVGPEGRVYANEVSEGNLGRVRARVEDSGADNVVVVRGSADDANLPDGCCDALMLRMVYHHLTDPGAMNESFWRALRPGGRLVIIEGDPNPNARDAAGVPDNRGGMGIAPDIVIDEVTRAGFELERTLDDWPGGPDHALVFRKPGS